MQRTKFKKWRRETPNKHRTFGEKRNRADKWWNDDVDGMYKEQVKQ